MRAKMRTVSIIAWIVLAAGLYLDAQARDTRIEISCWTPFPEGDGTTFADMVDLYNASQDRVRVKLVNTVFNTYYAKLNDAIAAGNMPDVVALHQERFADYCGRGSFLGLDDLIRSSGLKLSDFEANLVEDCRSGGSLYALPLDVHPLVLYYNKTLFAKAGVEKVPATLAELVEAGKAVKAKTGALGVAMETSSGAFAAHTLTRLFMTLLRQQGDSMLDADKDKVRVGFSGRAGIAAYQAISDLVYKHGILPWGLTYDFALDSFRTGKAGMHINGVWAATDFAEERGLDFGVAQFPPLLGKRASWSGSHILAISSSASADRAPAALEFIDWMTAHAEIWARGGYVPARRSVYSKPEFTRLPFTTEYAEAAKNSFAPPSAPEWPKVYFETIILLEDAISAGKDAKDAVSGLTKRIEERLGRR